MNPVSPGDSGLINNNVEDDVNDRENNVKEKLVCDINPVSVGIRKWKVLYGGGHSMLINEAKETCEGSK